MPLVAFGRFRPFLDRHPMNYSLVRVSVVACSKILLTESARMRLDLVVDKFFVSVYVEDRFVANVTSFGGERRDISVLGTERMS